MFFFYRYSKCKKFFESFNTSNTFKSYETKVIKKETKMDHPLHFVTLKLFVNIKY